MGNSDRLGPTEARETGPMTSAASGAVLRLPRDLQDADVAYSRSGSDRAEALTRPDGLTDSRPPFGVGSGTARRSAPHAGQRGHLAGYCDGFAESLDGLGAARVIKANGDAEGFGFGAETAVVARLLDEFGVGHSGNLAYRGRLVKW